MTFVSWAITFGVAIEAARTNRAKATLILNMCKAPEWGCEGTVGTKPLTDSLWVGRDAASRRSVGIAYPNGRAVGASLRDSSRALCMVSPTKKSRKAIEPALGPGFRAGAVRSGAQNQKPRENPRLILHPASCSAHEGQISHFSVALLSLWQMR